MSPYFILLVKELIDIIKHIFHPYLSYSFLICDSVHKKQIKSTSIATSNWCALHATSPLEWWVSYYIILLNTLRQESLSSIECNCSDKFGISRQYIFVRRAQSIVEYSIAFPCQVGKWLMNLIIWRFYVALRIQSTHGRKFSSKLTNLTVGKLIVNCISCLLYTSRCV